MDIMQKGTAPGTNYTLWKKINYFKMTDFHQMGCAVKMYTE